MEQENACQGKVCTLTVRESMKTGKWRANELAHQVKDAPILSSWPDINAQDPHGEGKSQLLQVVWTFICGICVMNMNTHTNENFKRNVKKNGNKSEGKPDLI